MAEISELKSGDRTIEILHPATGEPVGIQVVIMSIDDSRLKRAKRKIIDERNRLEARGKHFKAEQIEDNTNYLIFSAMVGWVWAKDKNGEQNTFQGRIPDFTPKDVSEVLDALPWLRQQLDDEIGDTTAFLKK